MINCDFEKLIAQTKEQLRQVTEQKEQFVRTLDLYARELSNLVEYKKEDATEI